jgi:hypothetical protein
MNPKVFVCHASEDKERFVMHFATKLRNVGIDAWLDKWEMLLGDSLVDKIFEEGLKQAQAVIVVISKNSIEEKWVKEDINASFVDKVTKGTKIIPVVLDNADVPEALKSTKWEKIEDLDNYDQSFNKIMDSIFSQSNKPHIGFSPNYIKQNNISIEGLTSNENLVLKKSCEFALDNNTLFIHPRLIFEQNTEVGLNNQQVLRSIEFLDSLGYVSISRDMGGGEEWFGHDYKITDYGFDKYAHTYLEEYNKILITIIGLIVNEKVYNNFDLSKKSNQSLILIDHIIRFLESNQHIKISESIVGKIVINHTSSTLARLLD